MTEKGKQIHNHGRAFNTLLSETDRSGRLKISKDRENLNQTDTRLICVSIRKGYRFFEYIWVFIKVDHIRGFSTSLIKCKRCPRDRIL